MISSGIFNIETLTPDFRAVFDYQTDQQAIEIIQVIAKQVASIYADFLTHQGHSNRSKALKFYDFPKTFPTKEEVEKFRNDLEVTIITKLSQGSPYGNRMSLLVDHVPQKVLDDVLSTCGIATKYREVLFQLFPFKTETWIFRKSGVKKIEIWMTSFDRGL